MSRGLTRRSFLACAGALAAASLSPRLLAQGARPRYALLVDLARCSARAGCDACRTACHQAHAVPSLPDPRHEVKWIWREPFERVFPNDVHPGLTSEARQAPVPVTCNHCENPPCVRVCPTGATFQRPDGLVAMDEHRCIGCRYCMAACPYGARSFNFQDPRPFLEPGAQSYPNRTRGVVEKCTFCVERIGTGRPPACVESCPVGSLRFGDRNDPDFTRHLLSAHVLRRRPELGTAPNVYYLL